MKKKILLIVSICLCLLGMTACQKTDPTTVDYNGHTYDELQGYVQSTVSTLSGMSDEDKAAYLMSDQEMTVNLISRWDAATDGNGPFMAFGDFEVVRAGKTLTAEQELVFEQRPVMVTFVYHYSTMELEDVTVEPVRAMKEKMTDAAMNTIMGMGTVFVILILISLVIYAFRLIPYLTERKNKASAAAVPTNQVAGQITQHKQRQDDLELTAVIAAAIAAATGTSTDDFVVRSIKRR